MLAFRHPLQLTKSPKNLVKNLSIEKLLWIHLSKGVLLRFRLK